jgi:hypothetical protein
MEDLRNNVLAFLAIIIELLLGAIVFYVIVFLAHILQLAIVSLGEPQGSIIYLVSRGGEIFLLLADCVIGLLFVTNGVRKAWLATWGSRVGV